MKYFVTLVALFAVTAANPLYTWSLSELQDAVANPNTNPELMPYLEVALNGLTNAINNGYLVDSIVVPMPANVDVATVPTVMTLQELSQAFKNPLTNPAAIPYLEDALNELMSAMYSGENVNSVVVYLPVEPPTIIDITPALPEVVPEPVVPEAVVPKPTPSPDSSPLVQIIINVNSQQQQVTEVSGSEIVPTPVHVVDEAIPNDVYAMLR